MKNLWSSCRLIDAKIRASDKDLPVLHYLTIFGMGWDGGRNIDHNLTLFSTGWEINLNLPNNLLKFLKELVALYFVFGIRRSGVTLWGI